jgi:hypothetical protein
LNSEGLKETKARGARISPTPQVEVGGQVRVLYGIHALSVGVAGKTVGEVREALGQAFNISPRAIALVDGQEVSESHILLPGQHLEFVRQAGEKGCMRDEILEIVGDRASLYRLEPGGERRRDRQVALRDFLGGIASSMDSSQGTTIFLPSGTRYVKVLGASTGVVVELPPEVRRVTWSPAKMEAGGAYTSHWLAFPYVIHICMFYTIEGDEAYRGGLEEMRVYYRNAPLRSPEDPLYVPNLFNVQVDPVLTSNCRACLRGHPEDLQDLPLAEQLEVFINFFWETGFNLDIESNGFERARTLDPRISSLEAWEEATRADPLFPLRIRWEPAGCTPRQVLDRLMDVRHTDVKPLRSASDVADLMYRLREVP